MSRPNSNPSNSQKAAISTAQDLLEVAAAAAVELAWPAGRTRVVQLAWPAGYTRAVQQAPVLARAVHTPVGCNWAVLVVLASLSCRDP